MMKKVAMILVILSTLGIVRHIDAQAREPLVRFEGGIGVIPAQSPLIPMNLDGSFQNVVLNVVRGVRAGSAIWRIADLNAVVDTDGRIKVRGRGLLLASGNLIGQNANQSVFSTLICEAAAPFVERNTTLTGVSLEPNGDFRIDDTLVDIPSECPSPLLLIRSAASGVWFAAGIPKPGND